MTRFTCMTVAGLLVAAVGVTARADVSSTFSTNPLTDGGVVIQGPDAGSASSRFTYDGVAGTVTAHYDTSKPTIKLEFPLGQHFTQNSSFVVTSRFEVLGNGFVSPDDFSAEVASFGLVNSTTTGNLRASTADKNFVEVVQGTSNDLMTFDYFPTATFGNSVALTLLQSASIGGTFNTHFGTFNSTDSTLPFDQFITATIAYNGNTHMAHMTWGSDSVDVNFTGDVFDTDSFAITLWSDPGLTATDPAIPFGEPVKADMVFDSFSVQAVPEPASLGMLAVGSLLLFRRRRA